MDEVIPFEAVRTERGLMQGSLKRRTRWERIVLEASQQSRRVRLPIVSESLPFEKAVQFPALSKLFLEEDASAPPILQVLPLLPPLEFHVAFMLGPEGGWTDSERVQALENGWQPCSLGSTVLRAETAGIAGLAVVRAWAASGRPPVPQG